MRVVYATDLDNTLIYSHKFIAANNIPLADMSCIEQYSGKDINYLSNKVNARLQRLLQEPNCLFLPVTTRRTEQFLRLHIAHLAEYAIVANGGVILHKGVPMQEWADIMHKKINYRTLNNLVKLFDSSFNSLATDVTICDSCFIFFKLENPEEFSAIIPDLEQQYPDWVFVQYGKKCYAFPNCCSKGNALQWLNERLGYDYVVSTGDSILDETMLNTADLAVVPSHSSLCSSRYTYVTGGVDSPLYTMDMIYTKL